MSAKKKRLPWRGVKGAQYRFLGLTLTPIMIYLLVFTLLPMAWAVGLSFFRYTPVRVENPFVGLANYRDMFFADTLPARQFRISVLNTFIFAFLVLPLNLAITLPLAVLINSVRKRLQVIYRAIYFLPVVTAAVAVAIMWGYMYDPAKGLLNQILKMVGLPSQAWLSDPRARILGIPLPMLAVVVAYLWQDMGYNLVIFLAGLQGIPQQFRDAAVVDGANAWQVFWKVTLPLLRPVFAFVVVMTMLSSFQVFVIFEVMTDGGPRDLTHTMVLNVYKYAFRYQKMGWAAAVSMVLFLIVMMVTVVETRLLRTEWEY